jgi:serine/threonine-protein kinase
VLARTGSVRAAGTRTLAARPLDAAFIDQAGARLAVYVGPIAKVLARRAAQGCPNADEFVRRLAEHLGTQERAAFLHDVGYGSD